MERDALEWLQAHTQPFAGIECENSESDLIARPTDVAVQSLEQYQKQPNRIKQLVQLQSVDSFIGYVNRFKEERTTIYMNTADMNGGGFAAVLDHHAPGEPSWCNHMAVFKPQQSVEWITWGAVSGKALSQRELAEFIERNLNDIETPEPSVMLQAALAFEANEKMTLASTINLDDGGVKFNFAKENVNKTVTFPHRIRINIPVYENDKPRLLELRVRYKTNSEGVLTFTIWMVDNADRIERDVLLEISRHIEDKVRAACYEGIAPGLDELSRRR